VREFVHKESGEEQHSSDNGRAPDNALAPLMLCSMEVGGKRKRNQNRNQKPAVMEADFNSSNAPEFDL
jgi:hypothetical protein